MANIQIWIGENGHCYTTLTENDGMRGLAGEKSRSHFKFSTNNTIQKTEFAFLLPSIAYLASSNQ